MPWFAAIALLAGLIVSQRRCRALRLACAEQAERAQTGRWADAAPVPICVSGADDAVVWANAAARARFAAGGSMAGLRLADGIVGDRVGWDAGGRVRMRDADGCIRSMDVAVRDLDAADGGWRIRALADADCCCRLEDALLAAHADAVLGQLAGKVAHEVNNPLEAIKIYIDPLRRRVRDMPEVDRGLVVIDQQVDRIARLVRSLLGVVRQRHLRTGDAGAGEVVGTVAELMQPRFAKHGRRLELDLPEAPLPGGLDADAVQQVLLNLLENALAAAPLGGWVRLRAAADDGWLDLHVSDNGPGLGGDPERLFEPFVSGKPGGSGIGLTIARRLCEAHGGSLTAADLPGGGACFRARLRLDPPDRGTPP